MESIDKAVVCLDFTESDFKLIAYADFFTHLIKMKEITFIHVLKKNDLPDEMSSIFKVEGQSFEDFLLEKMRENVKSIIKTEEVNYDVKFCILEGSPMEQVVKFSNKQRADLVMIGRKTVTDGSGIILTRVARRINCSVMIVPEESELFLDDILVCADFSEWSKMALAKAIEMADSTANPAVYCQHIFEVPTGYHATGKSFNEFAQIMKGHALKRYENFIADIDKKGVTIAPILTLNKKSQSSSAIIKDTAASLGANIVIVGSKGRTFASSIFLGSFAEKLVRQEMSMPLMIVKGKDETIGVIKALQMI